MTQKEANKFIYNYAKDKIGNKVKPNGYGFKNDVGAYVATKKTVEFKDEIVIGYQRFVDMHMHLSVYKFNKQIYDLLGPIISKRYTNYYEKEKNEVTVSLIYFFNSNPNYVNIIKKIKEPINFTPDSSEYDIPDRIDLIANFIEEAVIPELDKMNNLVYLHNWLMSIIEVNNSVDYWGSMYSYDSLNFHGFKHMAICKLIGSKDYEVVCKKMEEYMNASKNYTSIELDNLKPTYEELRVYLDKM